jgi:phage terminase small subunit
MGEIALTGKLRGIPLGPKMLACNERQRVFAFAYAVGIASSAAGAARLAGYSDPESSKSGLPSNSLNSRAHQLLHTPKIVEAIEEICRTEFRNLIPLVISSAKQLLMNPEHRDHAKTVMGLLSRLGYGEKSQVDVNVAVEVDHNAEALEQLRILKGLGVSRDKLLETFGHSGLGIYEAKLAALNAKEPKVIEHLPVGTVAAPARLMDDSANG